MQPPLALTSTAHAEQAGWRKGQDLMDALPYVDALTPEEKQAVDRLIEEEVGGAHWGGPDQQHPHACEVTLEAWLGSRASDPCLPACLQMRRGTKRPADYLKELPPIPAPLFVVGPGKGAPAVLPYQHCCTVTVPCLQAPSRCRKLIGGLACVQGDEILENEVARVEAGEKMAGMDTQRYNLDAPPAAKRNDVAAWRQALDNAYSQLEHQYNRWAGRPVRQEGRGRGRG